MSDLTTLTEKCIDETKEFMGFFFKELMDLDTIETMDSRTLEMMKKSIALCNDLLELSKEQAKVIDSMDDKLDKILRKVDAR